MREGMPSSGEGHRLEIRGFMKGITVILRRSIGGGSSAERNWRLLSDRGSDGGGEEGKREREREIFY